MSIPLKFFYMLRHGQSEANVLKVLSGSRDVALTDQGRQQAEASIPTFLSLKQRPTIIVHSHRQRARETAQIINRSLGLKMIEDERVAEQDFGDWEGQKIDFIRPAILSGEDPPNGETNEAFSARIADALTDHLTQHPTPVLFVTHGGLWRGFAHLYGQKLPKPNNSEPYCFAPNTESTEFPWKVSDFRSPSFGANLKM